MHCQVNPGISGTTERATRGDLRLGGDNTFGDTIGDDAGDDTAAAATCDTIVGTVDKDGGGLLMVIGFFRRSLEGVG